MKKKFLLLIGLCAIALLFVLNLMYAADNYGIVKNNLSVQIIAQTGSGGDGSGSGSGSGGSSGGDEIECEEGIIVKDKIVFVVFCNKKTLPEDEKKNIFCHTPEENVTCTFTCETTK